MIHDDKAGILDLQFFSCFLKVFYLDIVQRFHCHSQTADVSVDISNSGKLQHSIQEICKDLPGLFLLACYLDRFTAFGDTIDIFYQKTAFSLAKYSASMPMQ